MTTKAFYGSALQEVEAHLAFTGKAWAFGDVVGQNSASLFLDEDEDDLEAAVEEARERLLEAEVAREDDWLMEAEQSKATRKKEIEMLRANCQ